MTLLDQFQAANDTDLDATPHKTSILSVRFTPQERAKLEELAGSKPLGAYIREQCLGDNVRKRRSHRRPRLEDSQYSSLLASMGESRVSSNLNQLARHANMGTLDVSESIEQELRDACEAVLAMRKALFVALGLKP